MCYLDPGQRKWFLPPTRPAKMTPSNSLTAPHVFLKFYIFLLFFTFSKFLVFMGKNMMTLMNKISSFISAIKSPLASGSTDPPLLFVKCCGHKKTPPHNILLCQRENGLCSYKYYVCFADGQFEFPLKGIYQPNLQGCEG